MSQMTYKVNKFSDFKYRKMKWIETSLYLKCLFSYRFRPKNLKQILFKYKLVLTLHSL